MNVLFYTPINTASRDIESQALEFHRHGHRPFLLTQSLHGVLQESFKAHGFDTESYFSNAKNNYARVILHIYKLVSYCRKHRIDIVYAHLEPANFIAVLSQYLLKARVIICRHHMDYANLNGFDKDRSYRLTYALAREIIVVSQQAKQYMIDNEQVNEKKIHYIPLSYNFELYAKPSQERIQELRTRFSCDLLLLTIGRLTIFKRQMVAIDVLKELRDRGTHAKLIVLGRGDAYDDLQKRIADENLNDFCLLLGYVENVLDYMAAADLLLHPSISESSCITVKEAGLVELPVVVCKGVGDFDDVIVSGHNGFAVDKDNFVAEALNIAEQLLAKGKGVFGSNLKSTILQKFDIHNTYRYYNDMINNGTAD